MNIMKKIDLYDLYSTLDTNNVTVQTERFPMAIEGSFRIETQYICGDYMIEHTKYIPESKINKLGQFAIYKGDGVNSPETIKQIKNHIASWNQSYRDKNGYVYDVYVAIKNKASNKPYINPFKKDDNLITTCHKFEHTINEALPTIVPAKMQQYRKAITTQMTQFFEKLIKQYQ